MKKRYTEEQIIRTIKEHEAGAKVGDLFSTAWHFVGHILQLAQ